MYPVERALWFIEHKFGEGITLDSIAENAGVTRFHLVRIFGEATGLSVMRYVRARRLSEAARSLADGAADILAVALDAGYQSHEAFTRAFRERFGVTPEHVRATRRLDNLQLVEPIRMDKTLLVDLEPPHVADGKALLIAGLGARYTFATNQGIPMQWQRFSPHIGHIAGEVGGAAYGVCCNCDDTGNFEYIAGVEVKSFGDLPPDFSSVRIPPHRYLVFSHRDHISGMRKTAYTIWNKWLPESGRKAVDAPNFERYGPEFDPRSGTGLVEIWVPIEP
jgi:AraC family transcriptional regulator